MYSLWPGFRHCFQNEILKYNYLSRRHKKQRERNKIYEKIELICHSWWILMTAQIMSWLCRPRLDKMFAERLMRVNEELERSAFAFSFRPFNKWQTVPNVYELSPACQINICPLKKPISCINTILFGKFMC